MVLSAPRVGLALIARDEAGTLPTLLSSIVGAFDRVILVDTGSTDETVRIFEEWAERHVGSFATATMGWEDDFAAARNAADELLLVGGHVDWTCWADCDDELRGAQNLRALAARATPDVAGFVADYHYAHDEHGNCVCVLKRERLVRAEHAGQWGGAVHEAQMIQGMLMPLDPGVCTWVHRKRGLGNSSDRNTRILTTWNEREPDNPRVLVYLGTERMGRNEYADAIPFLQRYLELPGSWLEERAQVHRKLAVCHLMLGQEQEAQQVALQAVVLLPDWPDTYLTLAHVAYHRREWANAVSFCRRVLEIGHPASLLILNPLDYSYQPLLMMAGSLGELGRFQEAIDIAGQAVAIVPNHPGLLQGLVAWRNQTKVQHTRESALALVQLLVQHDEQAKALAFLEDCVPYYVQDDPLVVSARHQLRARTRGLVTVGGQAEHYRDGDEDGIPDERLWQVTRLPRAQFLRTGLEEQLEDAGSPLPYVIAQSAVGPLRMRPGDAMRGWLEADYELDVQAALAEFVKPGMVVADIGANVGFFARRLAELVGPDGRVHAVEPDLETFRLLQANTAGLTQVRCYQVAAGSDERTVTLARHPLNSGESNTIGTRAYGGMHAGHVSVDQVPLGDVLPHLDFALIDAQGHDHDALRGLGCKRPSLAVVEHWPEGIGWRGLKPAEVLAAYGDMGYSVEPLNPADVGTGHWNLLLRREA